MNSMNITQGPIRGGGGQMGMMNMMGSVKGGGKGSKSARPAGGPPQTATVRYEDAETSQRAAELLNGSSMNGALIQVAQDPSSPDGRRVMVSNVPSEVAWQEIKDHFNTVGRVQFADVIDSENISTVSGTVRYSCAEEAQMAIASLNGTFMNGNILELKMHGGTKDQTKINISGMPPGTEWQEVKDHFSQIGQIAFAETFNPDIKQRGEIRYDDPGHAQQAMKMLNGSLLGGSPISMELDQMHWTRLIIHGIPAGIAWQELKDHFKQIGTVAFSDIPGSKGSKGSKGSGKGGCRKEGGKGAGMNMMNAGGMNMMNPGGMVMIPAQMFNEMMQGMASTGQSYGQAKGCNRGGCGAMGGKGGGCGAMGGKGGGVGGGYGCSPYGGGCSPYGGGHAPMGMNPMQSMAPMNQMNDPPGSGRVLVRGFDFQTTEEQLLAHMGQAGQIFKADWITDGSIEVVYQMRAAAQAATGLDKSTIAGNRRFIDVRLK